MTTRSPGATAARLTARTAIDTGSVSAATAAEVPLEREHLGLVDEEALLQTPVDVDADELEVVAGVGTSDTARIAPAAGAEWIQRNLLSSPQLGAAAGTEGDDGTRHLVTLHAGKSATAGLPRRAHRREI